MTAGERAIEGGLRSGGRRRDGCFHEYQHIGRVREEEKYVKYSVHASQTWTAGTQNAHEHKLTYSPQ